MQSGVHLGFEGMHQFFSYMMCFIFSIFIFKAFFITVEKYLFQQLALIIFKFSNELHINTFTHPKNEIMKSRNLKKYHSLT